MVKFFLAMLLLSNVANAQVIAECGPSKGYSYVFPDSYLLSDDASREVTWEKDGFSSSKIILLNTPLGIDIDDTANGAGKLFSSFGATVEIFSTSSVGIIVGVIHPEYVNTYYFNKINNKLTWTRQNNSPSRSLAGAFVSDCIFE